MLASRVHGYLVLPKRLLVPALLQVLLGQVRAATCGAERRRTSSGACTRGTDTAAASLCCCCSMRTWCHVIDSAGIVVAGPAVVVVAMAAWLQLCGDCRCVCSCCCCHGHLQLHWQWAAERAHVPYPRHKAQASRWDGDDDVLRFVCPMTLCSKACSCKRSTPGVLQKVGTFEDPDRCLDSRPALQGFRQLRLGHVQARTLHFYATICAL